MLVAVPVVVVGCVAVVVVVRASGFLPGDQEGKTQNGFLLPSVFHDGLQGLGPNADKTRALSMVSGVLVVSEENRSFFRGWGAYHDVLYACR